MNQASVIIERSGIFYGQCSELCLWLDRVIDYGKEKLLLIFPSTKFSTISDVLLYKLNLKCNKGISHVFPLLISTYVKLNFLQVEEYNREYEEKDNLIRLMWSSSLYERPLTLNWDYGGFSQKRFKTNRLIVKDIIMQEIILVSNKNNTIRVTEQKSTLIQSINYSKLGNPVFLIKYFIEELKHHLRLKYGSLQIKSKSISKQLLVRVSRGQDNHQDNKKTAYYPNWFAYRICKSLNGLQGRSLVALMKYNSGRRYISTKPIIDRKLNKNITDTLKLKKWITISQKKALIEYIQKVQGNLTDLSKRNGMYSKIINYHIEYYSHTLLFQVYAIECLAGNKGSRTSGLDNLILENTYKSKIFLLAKLKMFYKIKAQPLKIIYISKVNSKDKRAISIPSIIDRAIQQLFLIILDPIIEAHSDAYSFGFRKGRNQIMAIGILQKSLQSKPSKKGRNIEAPLIWDADIRKCFDTINQEWLMKHIPVPKKYRKIFNGWLKTTYKEINSEKQYDINEGIPQGGIISPLLMNLTLNGMEAVIEDCKLIYKKMIKKVYIRYREIDGLRVAIKAISKENKDKEFKERNIACRIIRYADDFIVICGSEILLAIIQTNIKAFLKIRGLEIHPNKSRKLLFKVNRPFKFLGYTFIYLIQTKHIRSKFLHSRVPEYRLEGRPRLFVYPSKDKLMAIKIKIKTILKSNYNSSVFNLISKLNPIIRGWVNYFSFSNAAGTIRSLRGYIFNRLKRYLMKKHKRASIIWLMKHYFLLSELKNHHQVEPTILLKKNKSLTSNKWNFYGLAYKDDKNNLYSKPKLNILYWPSNIKTLVTATVFTPSLELLKTNYYNNREGWLKESIKMQKFHGRHSSIDLFESLWKRDKGFCYLCNDQLTEAISNIKEGIDIHHIDSWAKTNNNEINNLALVHRTCHWEWHQEPGNWVMKTNKKTGTKYSKNRTKLK